MVEEVTLESLIGNSKFFNDKKLQYNNINEYISHMKHLGLEGIMDRWMARHTEFEYASYQEFQTRKEAVFKRLFILGKKQAHKDANFKKYVMIGKVPLVIYSTGKSGGESVFIYKWQPRVEFVSYFPLIRKSNGTLEMKLNNFFTSLHPAKSIKDDQDSVWHI